jgi:molecular chaperone DnaJ
MTSLSIRRERACENCGGTGRVGRGACPVCHGSGRVAQSETVKIKIPEGTENGGTIRVPGKGSEGILGGPPGDLYVTVRVSPHPYFERQGDDIHGEVPITVKEAYAGAEIEIPTIHGTLRARIPPGTQSRQKFRLRGKGVKSPRSGVTGDHIYTARVMVPRNQTPAGSDAVTLLDSLYEGSVRKDLPKGL